MQSWGEEMKRTLLVLLLVSLVLLPVSAGKPTVAVVLSGGGARGIAHIAVLEAIEASGIPIDMVLGTSMGALVGGLYSSGYTPKEIRQLLNDIDLTSVVSEPTYDRVRLQDKAFTYAYDHVFSLGFGEEGIGNVPALVGDQRILELLGSLFSRHPAPMDFDSLPTPFRAISTDAATGERIVHDSGSLVTAVRSSISIPIMFAPYPYEKGKLAIDGGVVDNIPIELARSLGADIVIACDVNAMKLQSYEHLESLSGIAMQAILLVTNEKSNVQHSLADVLILPDLNDIGVLDFSRYDLILERGKEAAKAKEAELTALAESIEKKRELVFLDENRIGSYQLLAAPAILQINVNNLSMTDGHRLPRPNQFTAFLGKRFDQDTADDLSQRLREIRRSYGLSSIGYEFVDNGALQLNPRGFSKRNRELALGIQGDTGLSGALPSSIAWYRADVFIDAVLHELGGIDLSLLMNATLGQETGMQLALRYPFAFTTTGQMDVSFALSYASGGMTFRSAMTNMQRTAPLDNRFSSSVTLGYRIDEHAITSLQVGIDLFGLNDPIYPQSMLVYPNLEFSLVYNTLKSHFDTDGYRFDALLGYGYDKQHFYSARLGWNHVLEMGKSHSLSYDVQASMLRQPFALLDSYARLGGVEGVPGYGPLSMKRDLVMLGVGLQHSIFDVLGYPTQAKILLRGAVFDGYDPNTALPPTDLSFLADPHWDLGFGIMVGLAAPLGEVIMHLGVNLQGKVTLSFGVY